MAARTPGAVSAPYRKGTQRFAVENLTEMYVQVDLEREKLVEIIVLDLPDGQQVTYPPVPTPEPEAAFAERLRRRLEAQVTVTVAAGTAGVPRWRFGWTLRSIGAAIAALLLAAALIGGAVYAALIGLPWPGSPPPPASLKNLRLVAQGVDKSAGVDGRDLGYAFIVENHNEDLAAQGATYRVTAYGLRGTILATDSGSIPVILPGQRLGVGGFLTLASGEAVDRLGIEIESGDFTEVEPRPTLTVENVKYQPDGQSPKVTGIVQNASQEDVRQVRVSAVAYTVEGIIIGGGGIMVDSIAAGGQETVEVPGTTSGPPAKVDLYAGLISVSIDGSSSPSSGEVASPSPALSTQCQPGPGEIANLYVTIETVTRLCLGRPVDLLPVDVYVGGHGVGAAYAEAVDGWAATGSGQHRQDEPLHVASLLQDLETAGCKAGASIELTILTREESPLNKLSSEEAKTIDGHEDIEITRSNPPTFAMLSATFSVLCSEAHYLLHLSLSHQGLLLSITASLM